MSPEKLSPAALRDAILDARPIILPPSGEDASNLIRLVPRIWPMLRLAGLRPGGRDGILVPLRWMKKVKELSTDYGFDQMGWNDAVRRWNGLNREGAFCPGWDDVRMTCDWLPNPNALRNGCGYLVKLDPWRAGTPTQPGGSPIRYDLGDWVRTNRGRGCGRVCDCGLKEAWR